MKWFLLIALTIIIGMVQADYINLGSAANQSIATTTKITSTLGSVTAIVGDENNATFNPVLKFSRETFQDANFTIAWNANIADLSLAQLLVENKIVKYKKAAFELWFYQFQDSEEIPEGGFEFLARINSKPATNYIIFKIETSNVESIQSSYEKPKDIAPYDEKLLGSISFVYDNKLQGRMGAPPTLVTVYRPLVNDSAGSFAWANWTLSGTQLRLTIPQKFLDTATYPIYIDPTFGYTTLGNDGSSGGTPTVIRGIDNVTREYFTAQCGDTIKNFTLRIRDADQYATANITLYEVNQSGYPQAISGLGMAVVNMTVGGFSCNTYNSEPVNWVLTAGKNYTIAIGNFSNAASGNALYCGTNTGTPNHGGSNAPLTTTFPNPWGAYWQKYDFLPSVYATYINDPTGCGGSFIPQFNPLITDPANGSTFTYGWNASFVVIIAGNATGYTIKYSTDYGATNTTYGNVANGTNFNITLGIVPATFSNLTVFAANGTVENMTTNLYTVLKASMSLSVAANPSGSSIYGANVSNTGTGCIQATCTLYFNRSGSPFYSFSVPSQAGIWGVGTWSVVYNTTGNENYSSATSATSFTITQYPQWANLTLEGSEANRTITFNSTNTASGSASNITGNLFINGQSLSNPDSNKIYGNGTYNFTYVTAGNENYSAAFKTWWLMVNKAANICSLTLEGSAADRTITYGTTNTAFGNGLNGGSLKRDGTTIMNPDTSQTYANGTYNFTYVAASSQNYTECSTSYILKVNKAAPSLSVSNNPASPITFGTIVTTTGSGCNSQITCNLFQDAKNLGASPYSNALWAGGSYTFTYQTTGGQNYSAATSSGLGLTVNPYSQWCNLTINGVENNATINEGDTSTVTGSASNLSGSLYRNGINVGIPDIHTDLSNATYNYTLSQGGSGNYSACGKTWFLKVNIPPSNPFVPVFWVNITSPLNNTEYAFGTNILLNVTGYGNATAYSFEYSYNYGLNNITLGSAANGTPISDFLGTGFSAGLHNITVFIYNGTVINQSFVNFSISPQPSSFTPAFRVKITAPVNNSMVMYGNPITAYFSIEGNATAYSSAYSFNGGATNTTLGIVSNGSNTSISLGLLSLGNFGMEVYGTNGTVQNKSFVNFSLYSPPDIAAPILNITGPLNISYATCKTAIQLMATANESISSWWYNLNSSGTNTTFSPPVDIIAGNQSNFLRIWANDTSGNIGTANVTFWMNLTICPPVNATGFTIIVNQVVSQVDYVPYIIAGMSMLIGLAALFAR